MKKISPKQLIDSVPNIQTLVLPSDWFENLELDAKYSIFHHLYEWINQKDTVPMEIKNYIHNRTFLGEKL
ncbi:MAG: hypothetical protein VKN60_05995, partial [Cyanobacteriota bacterium]|nr:hypothetical protein [Cyanobacteriota bacterium]